MNRTYFAFIAIAVFVQAVASQQPEEDWRQHVIPDKERTFNFQTVPKGAIPEHQFVLVNPCQEPMRIVAVTSSCNCTAVDFDKTNPIVLQTYERVAIPVQLRGDMFDGIRNSTITVSLDQPARTEIQLNVRGEIRNDLHIKPDFINFGNVELGKEISRSLIITYTGSNTQWRIVDIKCGDESIRAEIINEPAKVGSKVFKVNVSLEKTAPNGTIDTNLILISNDAQHRREIPIPIRAKVGTVVTVTPRAVSLGVLSPGERSPIKDTVVRGTGPFRITKVVCDNPAIEVTSKNPLDSQSLIHSLSISYQNPMEGEGAPQDGIMRATVRVTTDVPGLTLEFFVTANVRKEMSKE